MSEDANALNKSERTDHRTIHGEYRHRHETAFQSRQQLFLAYDGHIPGPSIAEVPNPRDLADKHLTCDHPQGLPRTCQSTSHFSRGRITHPNDGIETTDIGMVGILYQSHDRLSCC